MEKKNNRYGVCGVYCGQCPNGNGRVKMIAGELKRLVDTVRYDWMDSVVKSFRFKEFRKGLEWFANAQCPMCLNGGGAPCENRKCAKQKGLESCLLCDDYLACKHTEYHREWYPLSLIIIVVSERLVSKNILKRKRKEAGQVST